jgi:hypothetical protein
MGATILVVAVGITVVVLGRWLYRNPSRLVPTWGIFNPENPGVKKVAIAYATFVIFFGIFACAGTLAVRLFPGPLVTILGLAIAIGGTWLLRPRLSEPPAMAGEPVVPSPGDVAPNQRLLGKHWKRALAISLGFAVLLIVIAFALVTDSDVSKLAFAAAQANPTVRQRLGEPVKRGFFTSGNIEISGPSGHADIEIPMSGPKGTAAVYAVATKSAGLWKLDVLQAEFNGNPERVDLLKQSSDLDQPPKP